MFTVEQILSATGGYFLGGDRSASASSISTDSRTIRKGDLFVPLHGDRFDGHAFIREAAEKEAAGLLIREDKAQEAAKLLSGREVVPFQIRVKDPLRALQELAAAYRRRFPVPMVGITGSNGKTTTKELTGAVLRRKFPVLVSQGNLNNHIGVPLTLFGLKPEHRAAVVEMGISAPGELRRLCEIAGPTVGVITNVGPAHLEGFGDIRQVASAKAEILDYLQDQGSSALNADDPFWETLRARARGKTISFGLRSGADVTAEEVRACSEGGIPSGVAFTVVTSSGKAEVRLPAVGVHNVYNALAAVSAGILLGLPFDEICRGLEGFTPLPMRMSFWRFGELDVLDDAYNANPDSMKAALDVLAGLQKDRTGIAVLGDMLELGDYAPQAHWELGRRVGTLGIHGLVAVGEFASRIVEGATAGGMDRNRIRIGRDPEHAAAMLFELRRGKTAVLVKGSRGMKMEKVIESVRKKYGS